jgi:hypothetical protein
MVVGGSLENAAAYNSTFEKRFARKNKCLPTITAMCDAEHTARPGY